MNDLPQKSPPSSNSFFQSISPESKTKIVAASQRIHYEYKKEQVFFFGYGQVLILESGFLMTIRNNEQGKKAGIDILKAGDLLGICQLFNYDYKNAISFLPLSAVYGYLIPTENLNQLIKKNNDLAVAIIAQFSRRFVSIVNHFAINEMGVSHDRLRYALKISDSLEIKQPTHEELAIFAGLNRVTVTKIINEVLGDSAALSS